MAGFRRLAAPALLGLMLAVAGCDHAGDRLPAFSLEDARFADLPGWDDDDHSEALGAFVKSCEAIERQDPDTSLDRKPAMATVSLWRERCRLARNTAGSDARAFFETWFRPWRVTGAGGSLFTGYFEPLLSGSRTRGGPWRWPLYRMPANLSPLPERAAIDAGALDGMGLELLWVDDPVDAFFLHVQGSGRVRLEDGSEILVGYAGGNGHPYTSIGKELIQRGEIAADDISMASIRAWLASRPHEAAGLMAVNRSYVFFRELEGEGPVGAQGVPLTPGRSLAVDDAFLAYGVPVWLETTLPDGAPWRRLMVAQDTGSAITGAVRGDIFFGAGDWAAGMAGAMKSPGRSWILLPATITVSLMAAAEP